MFEASSFVFFASCVAIVEEVGLVLTIVFKEVPATSDKTSTLSFLDILTLGEVVIPELKGCQVVSIFLPVDIQIEPQLFVLRNQGKVGATRGASAEASLAILYRSYLL